MNYSCILSILVLLISAVSGYAEKNDWQDKPEVARRVKSINEKLAGFRQVVVLSREKFMNEKMSWGSEFLTYKEDGCDQIEKSVLFYSIILFGIVLIILIFYFHIVYPELYLSEYGDNELWYSVSCNADTYIV